MSRHQYIRNLDYQDAVDEYEGYSEEEDELSPEDRALMAQGTADVREALGAEVSKVTVAQIEEALWHYYYDVDKSVAYLTSKYINPPPKSAKPQPSGKSVICSIDAVPAAPSELDLSARWAEDHLDTTDATYSAPLRLGFRSPSPGPTTSASAGSSSGTPSFANFFREMPWGNIPKHRETTFVPPPTPRGGLLGGSGAPPKMSKLQALAAARKKIAEEKNSGLDKVEQTRTQMTELSVDDATANNKENTPLAGAFGKRLKTSESTAQGRVPLVVLEPTRSEPSQEAPEAAEEVKEEAAVEKAEPSVFARTLFGSPSDTPQRQPQEFYVLYPNLPASILEAFSQPSPDDVVLTAQAKGSLSGRTKR
jgi:elongation factor 1 alpha-like protein